MSPRLDRYGDPVEDNEPEMLTPAASRRRYERKGRPIRGLARTIAELGGKSACCGRFICDCEGTNTNE